MKPFGRGQLDSARRGSSESENSIKSHHIRQRSLRRLAPVSDHNSPINHFYYNMHNRFASHPHICRWPLISFPLT